MNREGQVFLEFILSLGLLTLTLTGAGWVLHAQWVRGRCAIITFEAVHARAHESVPSIRGSLPIAISETTDTVSGTAQCGGTVTESVRVGKLQ